MKAWSRVMQGCGMLAAALLGAIVLLVCYDVAARNLGGPSLPWIVDITEFSLPLVTLLAAPWLMHRGEHVRLDLLSNTLPARQRARIDRLASLLALAVSSVLVWYSIRVVLDSRAAGALVMKSLIFPEWWLFVPVPLCFALLAGECARRVLAPRAG